MGIPLKRSEKVKYFGVIFDQKMQWEEHIKNISSKISFKLSKIKSIASCLTPQTKKILINALVMPYFTYCSSAWASVTQSRLGKLNKRLQAICCFLGRESALSIEDVLHKNDAILLFKAINQIAPDYLCSKIYLAKNIHNHDTRGASKNGITLPMVNSCFGKASFSF